MPHACTTCPPNRGKASRIHPIEHDGNDSFSQSTFAHSATDPLYGSNDPGRPLLYRLLAINELRQRYLAHMRTVLQENFNPAVLIPQTDNFHRLSVNAIMADPRKDFTMDDYTNDLAALKTYITNRYNYLIAHAQLTPPQPYINAVTGPTGTVFATNTPYITATATANGGHRGWLGLALSSRQILWPLYARPDV